VNAAMMADLQDRQAQHLIAPRPVPAPPFFFASRSCQRPLGPAARQGIYDQDSAICAIASNRLEPSSGIVR